MKPFFLFVTLLVSSSTLFGQNLIPNHSFEKGQKVDRFFNSSHYSFHSKISEWSSPSGSSPDIIHEPYIEKMSAGPNQPVRANFHIKPLKPKTGNVFVGIKVFGCVPENTHCREYLQIKTLKKMEIGQCYEFSYFTSPLTNGSRINNMGVAFSEFKTEEYFKQEILDFGNRYGEKEIIQPGPGKWQQIKGVIKATKEWNYMIIGNLFFDFETDEIPSKDGYRWGYYLVDEVSLIHVNCDMKQPMSKPESLEMTVFFESNSIELAEDQKTLLQEFSTQIKDQNYAYLEIIGHADEEGSIEFNQDLSMNRANVVGQHLKSLGISDEDIRISGYGEVQPLTQNDISKNRRVEIKVVF